MLQALKILDFDPEPELETFPKSEPETVINHYGSTTMDYGCVQPTLSDLFTFGVRWRPGQVKRCGSMPLPVSSKSLNLKVSIVAEFSDCS